ncbi:MAG: alkaline phosphatase [Planctomycetales bacterium]|nr:alkaline phosphatase [Planctomycetales bacterium]
MTRNTLRYRAEIGLFCLLASAAWAEAWNYPSPDPGRDVRDRSFYQAPAEEGLLKNSAAGWPRNVILLIGDGMGLNHVALARHSSVGAGGRLHMERLPVGGLARTYAANCVITDSSAAATALACGIKTDNGRVGISPDGTAYCSILELLEKRGWRTGLVATSTISHATPAAFASHVESRSNENEIAAQLAGSRVDVLFGGGRKYWSDELLARAAAEGYQVVWTCDQLLALAPGPAVGLFAEDGMTTFSPEPSLAQMTQTAIRLLSFPAKEWFAPKPKFFLMVEGSQIDWAAHNGDTDTCVRQTLLFDMAVREAVEFARRDGHTLVIVSADHETGGLVLETDEEGRLAADWNTKNHTGADTPVFAFGPGSEKFAGTLDNTDIPKRIAELTGIEPFPVVRHQVPAEEAAQVR